MIQIGIEALKGLQLLNGGAIVALLAYLGQTNNGVTVATHVYWPLAWFVIGLVGAMSAFLGIYFTQFSLFNEDFRGNAYTGVGHMKCLMATMLLAIISL